MWEAQVQALSQNLKNNSSKYAVGPAQVNNFVRQHMKNETIFFKTWTSRGRADAHLTKSLCKYDVLNERFGVSPLDRDYCSNVCKCKYDQISVACSLP